MRIRLDSILNYIAYIMVLTVHYVMELYFMYNSQVDAINKTSMTSLLHLDLKFLELCMQLQLRTS